MTKVLLVSICLVACLITGGGQTGADVPGTNLGISVGIDPVSVTSHPPKQPKPSKPHQPHHPNKHANHHAHKHHNRPHKARGNSHGNKHHHKKHHVKKAHGHISKPLTRRHIIPRIDKSKQVHLQRPEKHATVVPDHPQIKIIHVRRNVAVGITAAVLTLILILMCILIWLAYIVGFKDGERKTDHRNVKEIEELIEHDEPNI